MRNLVLLYIVFLHFSLQGQTPNWKLTNTELPQQITSLSTDSLGFLWISADTSLYRFNGEELEEKISFSDESIITVKPDNGIFYTSTSLGRVLSVNPYNLEIREIYKDTKSRAVSDIFIIDDNTYILLFHGFGVQIHLNGQVHSISSDNGLLSNEVYEIEEFLGAYYISSDQGILKISIEGDTYSLSEIGMEAGLSDIVIKKLKKNQNKLWYSDYDTTIGSINEAGVIENFQLKEKGEIKDMITHEDQILVLNKSGVYCFSKGNWVKKYSADKNISGKFIQVDEENNLWLIDSKNNIWSGNLRFQKIDLDIFDIRAITKVNDDFLIGNEEGLFVYSQNIKRQINDQNITFLTTFNDYVLVGTFSNGLMVYDRNLKFIHQLDNWFGIPNESILSIYGNKEYLFVSSLSGVYKMEIKNKQLNPVQSLNSVVGQGYIYSILADYQYMYFGTDRNGLVKWNMATDKIEKIDRFDNGEKIGSVYSMTFDDNHKLWFTSAEKGIGKIHNKKVEYLHSISNGNDEFTSISNLKDGALLLIRSSNLGLLQTENNHFMYFDKELGLKEETAFLNTITQDSINTYFINGNSIYSYTSSSNFKIHPEVIIDEVIVNLSSVKNRNTFKEDENNIAIRYKGSWLTDPSKLSYQFKLEGFDGQWRETKDDQVAFPKLSPGKYNFQVRAAENGIFSDEPEANFAFEIRPHFYNLWYIRLIMLGLLGFIIFQWRRMYENRKKEKLLYEKTIVDSQLINLKSQLNPHFLFNAFNTLIALIEQDNDRSIAFVEKMTVFYREMLELGKDSMVNLGREKYMLEQYIGILNVRFNTQVEFNIKFDEPENYEIPPMTLQLLVENAIKHNVVSKKTPLNINITQICDTITVWNNRNELIRDSIGTHTGLSNIKKRFELASLDVPIIKSSDDYFEVIIKVKKV